MASSTCDEIEKQIVQAMLGIASKVEDMQMASGIKDKIAQHWIKQLIAKVCKIKSKHPGCSDNEIVSEVNKWYKDQPGEKINPVLFLDGMKFGCECCTNWSN